MCAVGILSVEIVPVEALRMVKLFETVLDSIIHKERFVQYPFYKLVLVLDFCLKIYDYVDKLLSFLAKGFLDVHLDMIAEPILLLDCSYVDGRV